jgi:hypothetical protein
MIVEFGTDLRNAGRALRKSPAFTLTALVTLALAIGANSAIFTLANLLLLASLPVSHPDRLVEVSTLDSKGEKGNLSIPTFGLIQQQAHSRQGPHSSYFKLPTQTHQTVWVDILPINAHTHVTCLPKKPANGWSCCRAHSTC